MQVAIYARVSTLNQQQEGTIASQVQLLKQHIQRQNWSLLPEHEFLDEGVSGARLDRPALDRLRDCAQRGEFDAVVVLSPDRLARNYAHQWFLVEEFEKLNTQLIFLQNPFGDTPQGKLLTQMQGMIAEYERAQIAERMRRGRLDKARRGEFIPWAYACYGYRYHPKRHGCPPQVVIEPDEAAVVRSIYRAAVEEQLSCRQITKRLNESKTPTPSGKNQVWQSATVRNILVNRTYAGTARYNHRQPVIPKYRKTDENKLRYLKTGRSYRPESEWVLSEAPAIITPEIFDKAQLQLARNAEAARKMYQPNSRRYLLRTLVKCGECGLQMRGIRSRSQSGKQEYLYYFCNGHSPLTVGRATPCRSKNVRADRLDEIVWQALCQLLRQPDLIPQLHRTWVEAKQQSISTLEAQQSQLLQRRQRIERQTQRLIDAYQAEIIGLSELQSRRQKLSSELQQIDQETRRLATAQQQTIHWQQIIDNAETFHRLLGENLEQLSFEDRQVVAQCLISKTIVTGEEVDIHFVLPFESSPQAVSRQSKEHEGAPGQFYRLRLAHLHTPTSHKPGQDLQRRVVRIGTDKGLRIKLTLGGACQYPANQDRLVARFVPNAGLSVDLKLSFANSVPMLDLQFCPLRLWIIQTLLRRRAARPFHSWSPILSGFPFRSWIPQLGVYSQSCNQTGIRHAADTTKQIQHGKAAIADKDQLTIRQPTSDQLNDLPSPLDQALMLSSSLSMVAFRRTQSRQERQGPDRFGPRDLDQQHAAKPTQAAGLDEVRMRRSHRVAVDTFGFDLIAAPPLDRIVEAQDQFASRGEGLNQQSQQESAGFQGRPSRTVQGSMVVGEATFLAQPHDAQASGHSSFARRQDRSDQQDFGVLPNGLGEQWRELYNQGQQFGRQCQQLKTSRGKSGLQLTQSADSFSKIKNGQSRAYNK